MRDKRSYEIKRILRREFPNSRVKVRIKKFSGGEAIYIYTDALPVWKDEYNTIVYEMEVLRKEVPTKIWGEIERVRHAREEVVRKIKHLLRGYYHVDVDEWGETLLGGNTYLHVLSWEETKWI